MIWNSLGLEKIQLKNQAIHNYIWLTAYDNMILHHYIMLLVCVLHSSTLLLQMPFWQFIPATVMSVQPANLSTRLTSQMDVLSVLWFPLWLLLLCIASKCRMYPADCSSCGWMSTTGNDNVKAQLWHFRMRKRGSPYGFTKKEAFVEWLGLSDSGKLH